MSVPGDGIGGLTAIGDLYVIMKRMAGEAPGPIGIMHVPPTSEGFNPSLAIDQIAAETEEDRSSLYLCGVRLLTYSGGAA